MPKIIFTPYFALKLYYSTLRGSMEVVKRLWPHDGVSAVCHLRRPSVLHLCSRVTQPLALGGRVTCLRFGWPLS
ncbi:hypothetical protein Dimus_017119 [Dionaea muscipula]